MRRSAPPGCGAGSGCASSARRSGSRTSWAGRRRAPRPGQRPLDREDRLHPVVNQHRLEARLDQRSGDRLARLDFRVGDQHQTIAVRISRRARLRRGRARGLLKDLRAGALFFRLQPPPAEGSRETRPPARAAQPSAVATQPSSLDAIARTALRTRGDHGLPPQRARRSSASTPMRRSDFEPPDVLSEGFGLVEQALGDGVQTPRRLLVLRVRV